MKKRFLAAVLSMCLLLCGCSRSDIMLSYHSDSNSMFVEIRSNGLIKNANNDTYSLFLPRFIEIRNDKTEADDFEMIQKLQDAKTNLQ